MSAAVTSARASFREALARGGALGAGAGLCAALADVASTVLWLADGAERARLVVTLALAGAGAGAWLGVLVATVFAARSARALTAREVFARAAALLAAPLAVVTYLLFTGGRARRIRGLAAVRPVTWVLLVLLGALVATLATLAAQRARRARTPARGLVVATLVAFALALHAIDHRVLPRLYEYLHAGLGVGTALAFATALYVAAPRALSRRAASALCIASLIAGPCAMALLDRWDNVRAEVFGVHAPFVRHAVLAVESLRPAAVRRHRAGPRDAQPVFDTAGLPAHTGASVLLITIDALRNDRLRADLAPHLTALASEGTRVTRTYTQAPHSSYAITSLHTSEFLHETVPLGQAQPLATLADRLRGAGYYTAAFYTNGIFFTEGDRLTVYRDRALGFRRADHVDRRAGAQAEAAMREIDDVIRRGEPPTLLWVHFFDAHEPYGGQGPTAAARYDDAVRHVDVAVGALVAYARAHLSRELVIAVTADHGEEFGEHGGVYHGSSVYEEQVRVPLVLVGPGIPRGEIDTPAQLVDLAPTLLGLVGVPRAASMHGDDLRPWIVGRTRAPRRAVSAVNTRAMVTDGRDALVVDRRYGVRELYDLASDPGETRNLVTAEPARAERLDAALDAWSDAVGERATGRAVLARGRMGDRAAVPELLALARDGRGSIAQRREAMSLLAGYDDPTATAPLQGLLGDGTREIADAAATALGRTGLRAGHARLLDALTRDEPDARGEAAIALARLRDRAALPALIEQLYTGDEPAQLEAVDALGALGDDSAVPVLDEMLADDHLGYRVVLALGRVGGRDVLDRLARIARSDGADDVRANAGAALALTGDRTRIPVLATLIRADGAQCYAASAMARLGAANYDARNDTDPLCVPVDEGPVWRLLAARRCPMAIARTFPVTPGPGPATLVVRARGLGALRFEDRGREIAHVDLEPGDREWRIPLDARPIELTVRPDREATVTHIVVVR